MVPGFHGLDLIVILVIALLIFGPKKLPEMGSAIGKSIKEFRKGMNELTTPKEEEEVQSPPVIDREVASKKITSEYTATPTDGEVVKKTTSTTETHE
jgi:sec-independent protein translocase protein TatA